MRKVIGSLLLFVSLSSTAQCDVEQRPVIFIHGFLASGDTWSNAVKFFQQAGYCKNRLYAFDWNSVGGNGKQNEQLLSQFIQQIKKETGAVQVDLIGHSAGGGLARSYLKDSNQARNVAHYVHIGSRKWVENFPWFPNERCLNIFSTEDRVAGTSAGVIEGANNLRLTEEDHYQVATSVKSLTGILNFLAPTKKAANNLLATKKKVEIAGKALLLGDNQAMVGSIVSIYPVQKNTGERKLKLPSDKFQVNERGEWGPAIVHTGVPYEIELTPADSKGRIISYFFNSFSFSDPMVYLRGIPEGSRLASLLGRIPSDDKQSVLVIYSATGAIIGNRDSVSVNKIPVSTLALTPASKTIITSFVFDDGDLISSGNLLKQFSTAPFIGGADIYLQAGNKIINEIYFNGQKIFVPAIPSKDRILLAVFREGYN